jgi:chromosome segregation ATPase
MAMARVPLTPALPERLAVEGVATIKDLCRQDKTKIAELMHKLHSIEKQRDTLEADLAGSQALLAEERDGREADTKSAAQRIEAVRTQNQTFVEETAKMRGKYNKSMAYLKAYQQRLQECQEQKDRWKDECARRTVRLRTTVHAVAMPALSVNGLRPVPWRI